MKNELTPEHFDQIKQSPTPKTLQIHCQADQLKNFGGDDQRTHANEFALFKISDVAKETVSSIQNNLMPFYTPEKDWLSGWNLEFALRELL